MELHRNEMWKLNNNHKYMYVLLLFSDPDNDILFPEEVNSPSSDTSDYIAYNNVPMGVTHYKDRLFVTVPRRRPGIPSTLNYISVKSRKGTSPSFRGYPNFRVNELHVSLSRI